ncbi:MAG TPA: DUF2071 domain-containing protein [Candidatus Thermoplasmatota archaeon]|nr:DUF2071 domain-containing protein [Candidatus Thermoplasmatota archaeon]
MQAELEDCLVLAYALPAETLEPHVGPGLTLDRHGPWGFVAVALVQARAMRPAGAPRRMGQDFFLAGYRIFTRYRTKAGRTLRGLRILRSDTDSRRMAWAGNLLTGYHYHRCRVTSDASPGRLSYRVRSGDGASDLMVVADLTRTPGPPPGSPLRDLREARRFAGPLPFTFGFEAETRSMVVVEGRHPAWDPVPVTIRQADVAFLAHRFPEAEPVLANAFHVRDVPYLWTRGWREGLPEDVQ